MESDEQQIRDLVYRYADAVCRRDAQDWGTTWAEQGEWVLPGGRSAKGREAVVEFWLGAMAGFPLALQLVHNGTVAVSGDSATGRWYLTEHLKTSETEGRFTIGCYQDRYVREEGVWCFAQRHYAVLYNDEGRGDMTGTAMPFPALI